MGSSVVPSLAGRRSQEGQPIETGQQLANLEALIKEGREDIDRVCETLATFREEFIHTLKRVTRR
jgi:hypothetical protein